MSPAKRYGELKELGITDVLIFKRQVKDENTVELAALEKDLGIRPREGTDKAGVREIPFNWKEFPDFETPCRQLVGGLKILKEVSEQKNRKIYFHCTVGEDRTGALSGLFLLLQEPKASVKKVFREEMCKRGYSRGNPHKPDFVVQTVDQAVTPVFTKLAYLIQSGRISWDNIDADACAETITIPAQHPTSKPEDFRCKPQRITAGR